MRKTVQDMKVGVESIKEPYLGAWAGGNVERKNLKKIKSINNTKTARRNPHGRTENIFHRNIEENFPNPKKEMPIKVQEASRTTNRQD